jgi:ATP-dependent exoDNAse (exonuclease V) alpha subunit
MFYDSGARETKGLRGTDKEILENPYRLYELSRHMPEGLPVLIVDRGIFPEDVVRLKHPLEAPSGLESAVDLRRVRAFCVHELENAALNGHTLLSKNRIVGAIAAISLRPACAVTGDIITARLKDMAPEITSADVDGETAVQLERYKIIGDLIRKQVNGRLAGKRHVLNSNWPALLNQTFGPDSSEEEKLARLEKAAALKELGEARFSVLAGPAGAGKTSVLGIFCAQKEIQDTGLLLLAPTGKARVRMQELANRSGAKALTIAQFLNQHGRYDGGSGRYIMTGGPQESSFGTVIVDEASMLTEDMIGALFDALQGVKRFVFVGDPAQLPPIGAGRPFVDIIAKLRPEDCESRFPRVTVGYAELTIERRQIGNDRADLRFARWFSSTPPAPGEDDVFSGQDDESGRIQFVEWSNVDQFQQKLMDVLVRELSLDGETDSRGFNAALGATVNGDYDYFNASRGGVSGAVSAAERWQILSPLRGMPFGVGDINRQIHQSFRASMIAFASKPWGRSIPKPLGAERIVYGDKVLNLRNHRRSAYPKSDGSGYLANGEIGIAVGQFAPNKNPGFLNIEFASQIGSTYGYSGRDFGDEGTPILELAYALTVHKAQGSQFGVVIIVLPESHPILSRELLYTALTRHKDRVVVMHQGQRALLKGLSAPQRSETARRFTNLMRPCRMREYQQQKGSIFLQEGLIHRTSAGLAVRSKSELIIANALTAASVSFEYEKPLVLGGSTRYPDFTIDDEISGRTIYWEHLGMLERQEYRKSWEAKLIWYRSQGVLPAREGGGSNGTLVTTTESIVQGFDSTQIQNVIREYLQAQSL